GAHGDVTAGVEYYGQRGLDVLYNPQTLPSGVWGGVAHNTNVDVPSGVLHFGLGNFELNARATLKDAQVPVTGISPSSFDQSTSFERERRLSIDARYRIPVSSVVDLSARVYYDSADYQGNYTYVSPVDVKSVSTSYWARGELQGNFD